LGGGCNRHLIYACCREGRVTPHEFPDAFHDQVVGAGAGIDALLSGAAEWRADTVHKHYVPDVPVGPRITAALAHVLLLIETWVPRHWSMAEMTTGSSEPGDK
jgi:hypothetical protein